MKLDEIRARLERLGKPARKPKPTTGPPPRTDNVGMFLQTVILVFDSMRMHPQIVTECRRLLETGASEEQVKASLDMTALTRSINEVQLPLRYPVRYKRE